MKNDESTYTKEWFRKRKCTFITYCLQYLLNGFEGSFNLITLWIYSKQIYPKSPYQYYAIMNFIIYLPPIILNLFIGRFADKLRRPKYFVIVINFICLLGNILYLCSFNPALPVIGYMLLGFKYPLRPILVGEIARVYPYDEIPSKLLVFNNTYYLAHVSGPFIISIFQHIDFFIVGIHITFGNISGFIGAILTVIVQVLVYFFSHNVSKEFCLKEEEEKQGDIMENMMDKNTNSFAALMKLVSTYETLLLLVVSFFTAFFKAVSYRYLPIFVLQVLNKPIITFNIYLTLMSGTFFIIIAIVTARKITSREAFNAGIIAYAGMIIINISIYVSSLKKRSWTDYLFLTAIFMSFAIYNMMEEIFLGSAMAKCVNSSIQSYAEGTRALLKNLGSLAGAISVGLMVEYKKVYFVVAVSFLILLITLLLFKRRDYKNPRIIL